jgi:hypothetical protein
MVGLDIKDEKEKYKLIVEECLYFSDINITNIFICKLLLDPYNEYKLNFNEGNTLEIDIFKKWNLKGFDAVIGNPPYQDGSGNKGKGHVLWTKFIEKSLNIWLLKNGYLLFVNPSLWRQCENELFNIMKLKQIHYLEIHNVEDGMKTFRCATRYDFFLIENIKKNKNTLIKDEEGILNNINLDEWNFIPNMMFEELKILIQGDVKLDVNNYRTNYGADKNWISKDKKENFKYPVVYSINKQNNLSLKYSNTNKNGHFGLSKFIFSNGAGFFCDKIGEYGLTQWAYCIYETPENLENIKKCFESLKFKKIIKAIHLDSSSYNIKIMKLFKKDFWKEFI